MHATALLTRLRTAAVPTADGTDELVTPLGRLTVTGGRASWSVASGALDCGADGRTVARPSAPEHNILPTLTTRDRDTHVILTGRATVWHIQNFRTTTHTKSMTIIVAPGRRHRILHVLQRNAVSSNGTRLLSMVDRHSMGLGMLLTALQDQDRVHVRNTLEAAMARWYPDAIGLALDPASQTRRVMVPTWVHLAMLIPDLPQGADAETYCRVRDTIPRGLEHLR